MGARLPWIANKGHGPPPVVFLCRCNQTCQGSLVMLKNICKAHRTFVYKGNEAKKSVKDSSLAAQPVSGRTEVRTQSHAENGVRKKMCGLYSAY